MFSDVDTMSQIRINIPGGSLSEYHMATFLEVNLNHFSDSEQDEERLGMSHGNREEEGPSEIEAEEFHSVRSWSLLPLIVQVLREDTGALYPSGANRPKTSFSPFCSLREVGGGSQRHG